MLSNEKIALCGRKQEGIYFLNEKLFYISLKKKIKSKS